ncbi:hypothetical protein AB0H49_34140 [Nocardia sp. NPDC050713]|uniref:hypothetical protein n=1 Tax=Nocardia sp. NPDC050713 TaxID=3154511 RepID=UPI0033E02CC9
MTSTEPTATETHAPEMLAPGTPCAVCQFPMGRDEHGVPQICGNPVYVNVEGGGRLPKYCGGEEQAEWQAKHGTAGNARHRSELAAYPRKQLGLSAKEVEQLALDEAARQGIGAGVVRRKQLPTTGLPLLPNTTTPAAPVESAEEPAPVSAVQGLAELATIITSRVAAVRAEMDAVVAQADSRVKEAEDERDQLAAEVADERERLAAEVATEREALAADREEARAITERAESEIREAREAQLRAEGELASAQRRIAELEQALVDAESQRKAEVAAVRREEREEFRLALRELNVEIGGRKHADAEPPAQEKPATTTPVQQPIQAEEPAQAPADEIAFHIESTAPEPRRRAQAAPRNAALVMGKNHLRMLEEVEAGRVYRLLAGAFRGAGGAKLRAEDTKALDYLAAQGLITWPSGATMETTEGDAAHVSVVHDNTDPH